MTIAAGFSFDSGVLLCADTRYTSSMALYESKLFVRDYVTNDSRAVFVTIGSLSYSRMAIAKIDEALTAIESRELCIRVMRERVEAVLRKVWKEHIYPNPDRNATDGPKFWLILSLWAPGENAQLFFTDETSVTPEINYACKGAGEYLGHYLLRPAYWHASSLSETLALAVSTLVRIKRYDANCGGKSEFIILWNNGHFGWERDFDIEMREQYDERFEREVRHLYTELARSDLPEDKFHFMLGEFVKNMENLRADQKSQRDLMDSMLTALSKPMPVPPHALKKKKKKPL